MELRNHPFGVPRPYYDAEGNTVRGANASLCTDPAESETLCTCGRSMHENREIPVVPKGRRVPGRSGKTCGRNPDVDATGKSDTGIVPMNAPNKSR
jgi:RNA-directed DNA polymerase